MSRKRNTAPRAYEVVKLPVQGFKERSNTPLERLAVVIATNYREACQRFARQYAWLASNEIWRVRETWEGA